jgi:hypothetical protein
MADGNAEVVDKRRSIATADKEVARRKAEEIWAGTSRRKDENNKLFQVQKT